jgi:UDP-N-acetylglucosamine--N-acetylmuramyl-(pentapeptide) pyrophosphoryl-undecaprenol N-acetylglucosamine transferase
MSVAFDETRSKGRARLQVTGHPVRQELRTIDRTTVREGAPSHLLVLGGSQGARGLDAAVPEIAPLLAEKGISVVHQSRPEEAQNVATAYRNAKVSAHVVSFIDDMPGAYEWADIIVSRAGASSVAEIGCVNRPAIFVPYPFQQGTHQTDNAKSLVFRQKALLVEETQPDFARRLKEALTELLVPANFVRMKEAPFEPRGLDAGARIAKGILELVSKRGT